MPPRRPSPLALVVSLTAAACAPTYAPPPRTVLGGAPGRLDQGQMEVAAATTGEVLPVGMGGGNIGYALRPHVVIEGGIDGRGGGGGWTLGHGGVRIPYRWQLRPHVAVAVDGEGGLAVGVGGTHCVEDTRDDSCDHDGIEWWNRAAGGGYMGSSAALRLGPISLYSRGRLQIAGAYRTPATQWASIGGGLHVHIIDRADVWLGAALAHYANEQDSASAFVSELGLAFRFDPYYGWR